MIIFLTEDNHLPVQRKIFFDVNIYLSLPINYCICMNTDMCLLAYEGMGHDRTNQRK